MSFLKSILGWMWKNILFLFFPFLAWGVFFFEHLSTVIKSIWEYFFHFIKWWFQDFYGWAYDQLILLLNAFFSDNAFIIECVEFTDSFFTKMNVFFPMNEAVSCLSFISGTYTAVFLIRLIFRIIPFI